MAELREALARGVQGVKTRVEQGKAKLVGIGRPPKQREAFEVAAQPVTLDDNEKLVITTTAHRVRQTAADWAERDMQKNPNEKFLERIAKTVWKRTLGSEYFRWRAHVYEREILEAVHNNVFTEQSIARAEQKADQRYKDYLKNANIAKRAGTRAWQFIKSAVGAKTLKQAWTLEALAGNIDATETEILNKQINAAHTRFAQAFDENDAMIRKEMGEGMVVLDEAKPQEKAIIDKGRKLMTDYAEGTLTDDQFQQQSRDVWNEMKTLRPELLKQADLYTSSLFETARVLRTQVAQGTAMDVINARIANSEFRVGFGVMGAATSIETSATQKFMGRMEKTINRIEKNPLGALVFNEVTVGSAAALGFSAIFIPRSLAGRAANMIAPIVGGSVVGGAFGGVREYQRLWRERKVHMRDNEMGYAFGASDKQRQWFEKNTVKPRKANELIEAIKLPDNPTEENLRAVFGHLADTQARLNISSRKDNRIGMVAFSSKQVIESERTALYQAIRQTKQALESVDQTLLSGVTNNQSAEVFLSKLTDIQTKVLNQGNEMLNGLDQPERRALDLLVGTNPEVEVIRRRFGIFGKEEVKGKVSGIEKSEQEFRRETIIAAFKYGRNVALTGMGLGAGFRLAGEGIHALQASAQPTPAPADILRGTPFEQLMGRTRIGAEHWQIISSDHVPVPGAGAHIPDITIPHGTQLVANDHGSWDIVFNTTDPKYAGVKVVTDMTFDPNSKLDHFTAMDVSRYGLKLDVNSHDLPPIQGAGGGTFDVTVGDMAKEGHGDFGPWGMLMNRVRIGPEKITNINGATNFLKGLFREGVREDPTIHIVGNPPMHFTNFWGPDGKGGMEVDYTRMANSVKFTGLPNELFSNDQAPKVAKFFQDAVDQYKDNLAHHQNPFAGMTDLQKVAWRIGYHGQEQDLPTKAEYYAFRAFFGGGKITPYVTSVNLQELIAAPPAAEVPFVLPIGWHTSLEMPLENILMLYGYGSYAEGGLGWIPREEYEKRRSQTLTDDPQARLDESKEVADYLSRQDPEYLRELEEMDRLIGTPMSSETRAVITVPVFGEGKIIRKTLEQFLNQKDKSGNPINPKLFEIIVFENDTESRPKDQTENEIRKFKTNHPEMNVHYAYKRWTQDDITNKINTIGNGRKYNCDLALLRSSKRTAPTGELVVVNNDADLEGITPRYISDIIEEFDTKDYLDTIVGKRNLPDSALQKPNIRAGQRLWEIFDSVMRYTGGSGEMDPGKRKRGWPGMIGENSAMRASIYAAVGGYGPQAKLAEDQNLGDMIRTARNYDDRRFEYLNRLQTIKNPRRYLACMLMGRPLIQMYNDYHENKNIRNLNNAQMLQRISDTFDVNRFQKDADAVYQAKNNYRSLTEEEFDAKFQKTMGLMGAKYIIENGHVKITDAQRLIDGLNRKPPTP